jgi:hypothetical protein
MPVRAQDAGWPEAEPAIPVQPKRTPHRIEPTPSDSRHQLDLDPDRWREDWDRDIDRAGLHDVYMRIPDHDVTDHDGQVKGPERATCYATDLERRALDCRSVCRAHDANWSFGATALVEPAGVVGTRDHQPSPAALTAPRDIAVRRPMTAKPTTAATERPD